ncbi:Variable surface lipoprotein G (VpmaG) [Mycoplasmopsis agalactiae 14628]|uniref:Variable surface lipoprotein G (VpmaG) n=1 Tax=Mycoplasmopsis agalactiae 14628 TaxID=1110504 RepID=I5D625_MYCAA|nr:variable surface lipoprotein [Mycoplasmopsis agalactiae]EIN15134.1 Variable surface lipoprotein G (VpmaG) [Mycoplasmopsis agalactiae 14628]
MKKSKFLLLGSLSSLAAIPFVAAKCGDTKEEEKKPTETTPGNPTETPGGSQTDSTSPASTKVDLSNLEKAIKDQLNKLAKKDVKKDEVLTVLKTVPSLKDIKEGDLKTVEFKSDKLIIEANEGSKLVSGKYEFSTQTDSTSPASTKVDLSNLEKAIKDQLNKLAKKDVKKDEVLTVLKTVPSLKDIKEGDLKTVEFKSDKLIIEANEGSKLVSGKYEFSTQTDSTSPASAKVDLSNLEKAIKDQLNKLAKKDVKKDEVLTVLKTVPSLKDIKEGDLKTVEFKSDKLILEANESSKLVSGKYEARPERTANNTDATGAEIGLRYSR